MLHRIQTNSSQMNSPCAPTAMPANDLYNRNQEEDMKDAIAALYDFKRKLDKLHPSCIELMHAMLQQVRY